MRSYHAALVLSVAAGLFPSSLGTAQDRPSDVFAAVAGLERAITFTKHGVEAALAVTLVAADGSRSDFKVSDVGFQDGSIISAVDLRMRSSAAFLVLDLDGRCIDRVEMERAYGTLSVWGSRRADPDQLYPPKIVYAADRRWGKLVVGFKDDAETCARQVSFHVDNRKAAESGDARAMRYVGFALASAKDPTAAAVWYRRAIEAGDIEAIRRLGLMLEEGQGVPKDAAAANAHFRRAAEAGDVVAMRYLGINLEEAIGTEKDEAAAALWYRRAVDAGDPEAAAHPAS